MRKYLCTGLAKNPIKTYFLLEESAIIIVRGMEGQFKKIFSIGGSLLLGALIIFLTWKGSALTNISFWGNNAPTQEKNVLSVVPGVLGTTRTLGTWRNQEGARDLSTSTTDTLAYELIANYSNTQKAPGVSLTDAEIEAQAQALVKKIAPSAGPRFTLANLTITSDTSIAARAAYLAAVAKLSQEFMTSQTKGDFIIIFEDPKKMDVSTKRIEIAKNIAHYETFKKGLLATRVPSDLAVLHLSLVQTYSDMQNSLSALVEIYNDPMRGLAGLTEYRGAIENITILAEKYQSLAIQK